MSFAGVTYHVRGELVPELQVELSGRADFNDLFIDQLAFPG